MRKHRCNVLQLERRVIEESQGKNLIDSVNIENRGLYEILLDEKRLKGFRNNLKEYIKRLRN
jgi:hypothetical protein